MSQQSKPRVLVIGDVMLDVWRRGRVTRQSPEADYCPVFVEDSVEYAAGGAANVALCCDALGARVTVCGVVGSDFEGTRLRHIMSRLTNGTESLIIEIEDVYPTTCKTRLVDSDGRHVVRQDWDRCSGSLGQYSNMILDMLEKRDAVILSDYGKGVITPELARTVIERAVEAGTPVFVDSKTPWAEHFRGAFCIKPNSEELRKKPDNLIVRSGVGCTCGNAELLMRQQNSYAVIETRAQHGMVITQEDGHALPSHWRIPADTASRQVVDVSGAGDAVVAALATRYAAGLPLVAAAACASRAAAAVVQQAGTVPPPATARAPGDALRAALVPGHWRGTVALANGCFDRLHAGHRSVLAAAQGAADHVIVALNSDASVRRLKGTGRPSQPFHVRAAAVREALPQAHVVEFWGTPAALCEAVRPDVMVKGADYMGKSIIGSEYARVCAYAPLVPGVSTTKILEEES